MIFVRSSSFLTSDDISGFKTFNDISGLAVPLVGVNAFATACPLIDKMVKEEFMIFHDI